MWSCVIDEATRVREESWHAVRSTLTATRAPVRIIGNVKGRSNWVFPLARDAERGREGWHYARLTAYDAVEGGVLDAAEIADARDTLPDHVFRELYLAEPSDDGGNPFGIQPIQSCVEPLSDGAPVAWGWDVARDVDWTVGVGIDADGRVCRVHRWRASWGESQDRIVDLTGRVGGYIDATGAGGPLAEALQARGCPLEPFVFTSASKQSLMEGLATGIQRRALRYPEGVIVDELQAFGYAVGRTGRVTYSAPPGQHDDAVCALALAWAYAQRLGVDASRSREPEALALLVPNKRRVII